MLKVQSSFLSEGHNTVWSLWVEGRGGRGGGRKRWLPCDKRAVPSSEAWETGSAAHKALLWRRGNARSSKIRAPIWWSMTGACPPWPLGDLYIPPQQTTTPPQLHCWLTQINIEGSKLQSHNMEWILFRCGMGFKSSSSKITSHKSVLRWCDNPFVPCWNLAYTDRVTGAFQRAERGIWVRSTLLQGGCYERSRALCQAASQLIKILHYLFHAFN